MLLNTAESFTAALHYVHVYTWGHTLNHTDPYNDNLMTERILSFSVSLSKYSKEHYNPSLSHLLRIEEELHARKTIIAAK